VKLREDGSADSVAAEAADQELARVDARALLAQDVGQRLGLAQDSRFAAIGALAKVSGDQERS